MKIGIVQGTRPEIIKNYSIVKALRLAELEHVVLHTNQHESCQMQQVHFAEAGYQPTAAMPLPYQIGRAVDWVVDQTKQRGITHLLVNGDTAAALIGATAALYTDTRLAHVEAGLRSFDVQMIEERNRIMVDSIAHYLFTYTEWHAEYLNQNRELRGQVFCVGNTTVDLLHDFGPQLHSPRRHRYAYITLHRKELTDNPARMASVFRTLNGLKEFFDELVFPIHPRTRSVIEKSQPLRDLLPHVNVVEPLSFTDSLAHVKHAALVLTDSGCVQEEAYLFGVPCVTVRENTERVETIAVGANIVSGFEPNHIFSAVRLQLDKQLDKLPPVYGAVGAGHRIVDILRRA